MKIIDAKQTENALPWSKLVDTLRTYFRDGCNAPVRHHHSIEVPDAPEGAFLLMPAWKVGKYVGVKILNIFPGNTDLNLPAVNASYILADGITGQMLAAVDGGVLTVRRTAAASVLAADFLARKDSKELVMVGTGSMARNLIPAYADAFDLDKISAWGRRPEKARELAKDMSALGIEIDIIEDLEAAVRTADIVSCATISSDALVQGSWLKKGSHLDLVGAFRPDMRECDDEAMSRATVFVDTMDGALEEAGDVIQAIESGAMKTEDIRGDLQSLCRGEATGRQSEDEITVFKSVGAAIEDLAGAVLAYENTK